MDRSIQLSMSFSLGGLGGGDIMIQDGTAMAAFLTTSSENKGDVTPQAPGSDTATTEAQPTRTGGKRILLPGIQAQEHDVNRYIEEYERVSKLDHRTSESV